MGKLSPGFWRFLGFIEDDQDSTEPEPFNDHIIRCVVQRECII